MCGRPSEGARGQEGRASSRKFSRRGSRQFSLAQRVTALPLGLGWGVGGGLAQRQPVGGGLAQRQPVPCSGTLNRNHQDTVMGC